MHRVKCLTLVIWRGQGTCDRDVPAVINIKQPLTTETTKPHKHAGAPTLRNVSAKGTSKRKQHDLTLNTEPPETVGKTLIM